MLQKWDCNWAEVFHTTTSDMVYSSDIAFLKFSKYLLQDNDYGFHAKQKSRAVCKESGRLFC